MVKLTKDKEAMLRRVCSTPNSLEMWAEIDLLRTVLKRVRHEAVFGQGLSNTSLELLRRIGDPDESYKASEAV